MKTIVIVPAYNEEGSLQTTIDKLREAVDDCDFVVVNDGSKDGTADVCRRHSYPFIDLPVNLGLSGAFQAGMKYALKHDYDCAVQFDADGQHRAEYIRDLRKHIDAYDIVIGSRFVDLKKPHSFRMAGSNLIQTIIKLTTGKTIADPTSGMRAYNRRMIRELATNINYGPEPDTISHLIKSTGAKVFEVPVKMDDRLAGESYLNVRRSVEYMLRMTVSILFIQLFRR